LSLKISVLIPFYNEEDNIHFVLQEAHGVLSEMAADFEIIAIDDGSRDGTGKMLEEAAQRLGALRVLRHASNQGQMAAFFSGFHASLGEIIVLCDGDGQNDFHDVPRMLEQLTDVDAVFGQRAQRRDPVQKLIASRIGFFFRRLILNDDFRDTACGLKVMRRPTFACLLPMRGVHRFIPFLLRQAGFSYKALDVNHRPRQHGKTKYCLTRLYFLPTIGDLLFMFWYKKRNLLNTFTRDRGETDT